MIKIIAHRQSNVIVILYYYKLLLIDINIT